jgi:hypothetical protein
MILTRIIIKTLLKIIHYLQIIYFSFDNYLHYNRKIIRYESILICKIENKEHYE